MKILLILNIILVVVVLWNVIPESSVLKGGLSSIFGTLSPQATTLEECNELEYNGDTGINILFYSSEKEAKKYADFFKTISPFNENKNSFNFYYIDSYKPACEIYQGKALLCYDKETIKKAASCPHDFIVVIGEDDRDIRSSAYMNVMSINSKHSMTVLTHEFGHVFVNLAEEYVPAKLPSNAKNCVNDCGKFNIQDGCFQGCSLSDFYRSINNGIMRTLSSTNFGVFNKQLITNKITDVVQKRNLGLAGFAVDGRQCDLQKYYFIEGKYENERITINEKSIESGCTNNIDSGDFEYILITQDNSAIRGQFNPELIFTDGEKSDQRDIDGEILTSDINFYLKVDTINNPENIIILREGQVLSEISLTDISKERPCVR